MLFSRFCFSVVDCSIILLFYSIICVLESCSDIFSANSDYF